VKLLEQLINLATSILSKPAVTSSLALRIHTEMRRRGYHVSTGRGEINIIYVRGMNLDGTRNDDQSNEYNDLRILICDGAILAAWVATVDPGNWYVTHRINPAGAARIKPGQYRAWQMGWHRGHHEALVQTGGPVTVQRDDNEDGRGEGDWEDTGYFGINQHAGRSSTSGTVGKDSAGCLVVPHMAQQERFIELLKTDPRYVRDHKYIWYTTILEGKDI
jgi:hypothetical protein